MRGSISRYAGADARAIARRPATGWCRTARPSARERAGRTHARPTVRLSAAYDCQAWAALRSTLWSIPSRKRTPCGESRSERVEAGKCLAEDPRLLRGIGPRNCKIVRAARVVSRSTTTPMSGVGPGQGRFRRVLPRSGDRWRRSSRNEKVRGSNPSAPPTEVISHEIRTRRTQRSGPAFCIPRCGAG